MGKSFWTIATLSLALGATGWYLLSGGPDAPEERPDPVVRDRVPTTPTMLEASNPSLTEEQQQLLQDPAVAELDQQLAFQNRLQRFFDQSESLPPAERQQQATALQQQLDARADAGELTAGEHLMARMALLEHELTEGADIDRRRAELVAQQRQRHDAGVAEWQEQTRPQRESYQQKQRAILAEVQARTDFASDTERNRYLRQRLQEARVEVYGQDHH